MNSVGRSSSSRCLKIVRVFSTFIRASVANWELIPSKLSLPDPSQNEWNRSEKTRKKRQPHQYHTFIIIYPRRSIQVGHVDPDQSKKWIRTIFKTLFCQPERNRIGQSSWNGVLETRNWHHAMCLTVTLFNGLELTRNMLKNINIYIDLLLRIWQRMIQNTVEYETINSEFH